MGTRTSRTIAIVLVLAGLTLRAGFLAAHGPAQNGKRSQSYAQPLPENMSTISGLAPFGSRWARAYRCEGVNEFGGGLAIVPTGDGGLVVAGFHGYDYGSSGSDQYPWVTEIRPSGIVDWGVSLETDIAEAYGNAESIVRTRDGGYFAAGSWPANYFDFQTHVAAIKIAANGHVDWLKTYGGGRSDYAYAVQTTPDGGFIIVGSTDSFNSQGGGDAWILRLDPSGKNLWQKAIGGADWDILYSIQSVFGGDYVAVGSIGSVTSLHQAWVVKLSPAGAVIWQKVLSGGSGDDDEARSVCPTSDGGCLVAGTRGTQTEGNLNLKKDIWLFKMDGSGNVVWQKSYAQDNFTFGMKLIPTHDGGFVVIGDSNQHQGLVLKLSPAGVLRWQKLVPDCYLMDAFEADNGNLVMTGCRFQGRQDMVILSLGQDGAIDPSCSLIQKASMSVHTTSVWPRAVSFRSRSTSASVRKPGFARNSPAVKVAMICEEIH